MKIPYNHKKSWAGSISMLVFGFLVSIGYVIELIQLFKRTFSLLVREMTLRPYSNLIPPSMVCIKSTCIRRYCSK